MKASPRAMLVCAVLLVFAACSDDDSGSGATVTVIPLTTSSTSTSTTTTAASDATLGLDPPDEAIVSLRGQLFEDPFMGSGFHVVRLADERGVLVSEDSITGAAPPADSLVLGLIVPEPTIVGLSPQQRLFEVWVEEPSGAAPSATVVYTLGPDGWVATTVVTSASLEDAVADSTDYAAVAPGGPVTMGFFVSLFDSTAGQLRAGVTAFDTSGGGYELFYEGEIECTFGDPLECTTLSDDGILRPGDEGEAVEALQNDLAALGYLSGVIDGKYGSQTSTAVAALQTDYLLDVDGKAGPQTLTLIGDLISGVSELVLVSKDGIGPVEFGTPADPAYADLFDIFGSPDSTTGWYVDGCDGYDWLKATWDGFVGIFTSRNGFRQLDGWRITDLSNLPPGVLIAGGIRPTWTWSDFAAAGAGFSPDYGGFFNMIDLSYNAGRFVNPPTNPPAGNAAVSGLGTGTGSFVTC
jgi:hypothetical protein